MQQFELLFFFECRRKGLCGGLLSITLNVSKVRETGMISAGKYPAAPYNFFFSVWINLTSNFVFKWPDILSFQAKNFQTRRLATGTVLFIFNFIVNRELNLQQRFNEKQSRAQSFKGRPALTQGQILIQVSLLLFSKFFQEKISLVVFQNIR